MALNTDSVSSKAIDNFKKFSNDMSSPFSNLCIERKESPVMDESSFCVIELSILSLFILLLISRRYAFDVMVCSSKKILTF